MITKIGIVAGDIWNYLDAHDRAGRLEHIIETAGEDRDVVLMGIGWLAREGHVVLEGDPSDYEVKLSGKS